MNNNLKYLCTQEMCTFFLKYANINRLKVTDKSTENVETSYRRTVIKATRSYVINFRLLLRVCGFLLK